MTEMRLEFPQLDKLDKLETTLKALQQRVDEIAKWVQPDSFVKTAPVASVQTAAPTAPLPPAAAPAQASVPGAAAPATPTMPPVSAPIVTPTMPPVSAPVAAAPSYTLDQVGKAGADLIAAHPDKMQALMTLLQQFGVPAVQALKPDQIGAFATALRGLGAAL